MEYVEIGFKLFSLFDIGTNRQTKSMCMKLIILVIYLSLM